MSDLLPEMKAAYYARSAAGRLKLGHTVVHTLHTHAQHHAHAPESGGVLLGRRITGCQDIIVDLLTTPTSADTQARAFFRRARAEHQQRINEVWTTSRGAVNYLGEWHTHPEDDPSPSSLDLRSWRSLARECQYEGDELFFLIVGLTTLRAWEVTRTGSVCLLHELGDLNTRHPV